MKTDYLKRIEKLDNGYKNLVQDIIKDKSIAFTVLSARYSSFSGNTTYFNATLMANYKKGRDIYLSISYNGYLIRTLSFNFNNTDVNLEVTEDIEPFFKFIDKLIQDHILELENDEMKRSII